MEAAGVALGLLPVINAAFCLWRHTVTEYQELESNLQHLAERRAHIQDLLQSLRDLPPPLSTELDSYVQELRIFSDALDPRNVNPRTRRGVLRWLAKQKSNYARNERLSVRNINLLTGRLVVEVFQKLATMAEKLDIIQQDLSIVGEKVDTVIESNVESNAEFRSLASKILNDSERRRLLNLIPRLPRPLRRRTRSCRARKNRSLLGSTTLASTNACSLYLQLRLGWIQRILKLQIQSVAYILPRPVISFLRQNEIPDDSPQLSAVKSGDIANLRKLLVDGQLNPNDATTNGLTLLYVCSSHQNIIPSDICQYAVEVGSLDSLNFLLENGADPNLLIGAWHE